MKCWLMKRYLIWHQDYGEGILYRFLEAPALNMGVFVGIIAGLSRCYKFKYYNYRKLPDAHIFNGKRFVHLSLFCGQQLSQLH